MAVSPVRIVEPAGGADWSLLERMYAEVLAPSFPVSELEAADQLLPRLGRDGSFVAVALAGDGAPVGAMVADSSAESGVLLLSYLAVRAGARGGGVGSALLARLPGWRDRVGAAHVLAEVEDPRFHAAGPYGDPVARLRFYHRNGFGLVPVPFVQPRVRPGAERVGGLLLAALGGRPVSREVLRAFIVAYLREAEGLAAGADPTYAALLSRLDAAGSLDLLPLERYPEVAPLDGLGELVRRDYPATAAAAWLLGGERARPLLDRLWDSMVTRLRAGEPVPDPRRAVLAALVDELESAELWHQSDEPAGEELLAAWFSPPHERWAGWWRDQYTPPAWPHGPALRRPAAEAALRLAPIPRLVLVLSDVAGLSLPEAVSISGFTTEQHVAVLAAARNVVAALLDQRFAAVAERSVEVE